MYCVNLEGTYLCTTEDLAAPSELVTVVLVLSAVLLMGICLVAVYVVRRRKRRYKEEIPQHEPIEGEGHTGWGEWGHLGGATAVGAGEGVQMGVISGSTGTGEGQLRSEGREGDTEWRKVRVHSSTHAHLPPPYGPSTPTATSPASTDTAAVASSICSPSRALSHGEEKEGTAGLDLDHVLLDA